MNGEESDLLLDPLKSYWEKMRVRYSPSQGRRRSNDLLSAMEVCRRVRVARLSQENGDNLKAHKAFAGLVLQRIWDAGASYTATKPGFAYLDFNLGFLIPDPRERERLVRSLQGTFSSGKGRAPRIKRR
jgi:hypothetical protein